MSKNNIQLSDITEKDLDQTYKLFKAALYDVSVAAFGWEESFQHDRYFKAYQTEWFHWIEHDSKKVGYVCFNTGKSDIHVHLLIIAPEYQSAGYGKDAMDLVAEIARRNNLDVTLSTLKNNTGAVKFYKRLGYEITHQDEYFYDLLLKTKGPA